VQRFNSNADKESGRIVDTICGEEIDHVKKGLKWYIASSALVATKPFPHS
jgi:uncharacterized ferritin-like protein (DUF455 family)